MPSNTHHTIQACRRIACAATFVAALACPPTARTDAFGQAPAAALDAQTVAEVVTGVAKAVADEYFDPGVGATVAMRLHDYLARDRYEALRTRGELASALTRDLFEATTDKHLFVSPGSPTMSPAAAGSADTREARGRRENFGVREAAILPGNIGYLNITSFYRANEAAGAIASAMRTLVTTDALIIDLRENVGGAPDTVALLAGYLFDTPGKPLFEIVNRAGERQQYTTPVDPELRRNERRPVFLLTAARTFSAGEGLAFILQDERRATVVGERTAGAANPGRGYPASHGFDVNVPNGQVLTTRSGRNWEGLGVVPDVTTTAAEARERALDMARAPR